MRRQKRIIVANWKMNPPTAAEARILFGRTKRAASRLEKVETIICPPFAYLGLFLHGGSARAALGAQDVFWMNSGRATGEVSPEMLKDIGVSHCLIGHSERRSLGETDEIVAKKASATLKEGMKAILCIGEKERDAGAGFYEVLRNQIKLSLSGVHRKYFTDIIIAYEPLWAIGKSYNEAMTARDIRETAIFIRKTLTDFFGGEAAKEPPILYGGSVEGKNADGILSEGGVDGLLVGHKSLDAEEFSQILKNANAI